MEKNLVVQSRTTIRCLHNAKYFQVFFGKEPLLLSQTKKFLLEISKFPIKDYIPTKKEAINYSDSVLRIIEESLLKIKRRIISRWHKVNTYDINGYKSK